MLRQYFFGLCNIEKSGIYNIGTGYARPFTALAAALFKSLNKEPQIEFDILADIRDKYQYYTKEI